MKNLRNATVFSSFFALLFFGSVLTAQADDSAPPDNNGPMKMGDRHGWGMGAGRGMWNEKLGLTDSQFEKMKDLFKKEKEETQIVEDQTKIDRDTLKLKVDSKASDDAIQPLLDKLSSEEKELKAKRENFNEQFKAILTPTQQAKLLLSKEERGRWSGRGPMNGACWGEGKNWNKQGKKGPWKHEGHPSNGTPQKDSDSTPSADNANQ